MRIGKHSLNPLALARRARGDRQEPAFSPVAAEERSALLASSSSELPDRSRPSDSGVGDGIDPTQQLLTALGRFQRYVARGQAGTPSEMWSDDCMNQLIAAFEIAKRERWADVVDALTESARVLQTYEDAGRPRDCLPFLADSYEVLCLMVGDLIVGSVRPGVIDKWRRRYEQAVAEAEAAGLLLVQDDDADVANASPTRNLGPSFALASHTPADSPPFEPSPLVPLSTQSNAQIADEELPTLGELSPYLEDGNEDEDAETTGREEVGSRFKPDGQAFEESEEDSPTSTDDDDSAELEELPPLQAYLDACVGDPDPEPDPDAAPQGQPHGTPPLVAEVLDKLCECLSHLESDLGADREATAQSMRQSVDFLCRYAEESDRPGAMALCDAMTDLCRLALARPEPLDDRFFELAYAFCGAYVEANAGPHDPIAANWVDEAETLTDSWTNAVAAESPDASPEPSSDSLPERSVAAAPSPPSAEPTEDPSPEQLLQTAQRAAEQGHGGDAKVLALRAALAIAQAEAAEAEARLCTAERRLAEGTSSIETARQRVAEAEQAVQAVKGDVGDCENNITAQRTQAAEVEQDLSAAESRIAELDDQILALQQQRDEEVQRKEARVADLAEFRRTESEAEAELERLKAEEDETRVGLEDARQHVKHLQQRRTEVELAIEKGRETLVRQRTSLADIEATIAQVRQDGAPDFAADQDMLF